MMRAISLDQVIENEDDEQLRLVFADALSERGDARGELIAVQCALTARPDDAALRAREAQLLATHRADWFAALERFMRARAPQDATEYIVRRGFVDHLRTHLLGQPGELETLFALAPTLRSLEVNGEGLSASPSLGRLRRLCVTGFLGQTPRLLQQGFLDGLSSLDWQVVEGLPGPGLSRLHSLTEFRTSRTLRNLRSLPAGVRVLDGYGEEVIRSVLAAARPALREVVVRSATLEAQSIDALALQAPYLERLMLKMSFVSPKLLRRLFRVEWPRLRALQLNGVSLALDGARALEGVEAPNLVHVEFNIAQLGDAGARQVFASPWFARLERLGLLANRLTDDALRPLLRATHSLRLLDVQKSQFSNELLAKLKRLDSFRATTILH